MSNGDDIRLEIKNLGETQAKMRRTVEEIQSGAERSTALIVLGLHRFMTAIVHVGEYPPKSGRVGGRLKNSLFPEVNGTTGRIFTNVEYAAAEEERGGSHAFMSRTQKEQSGPISEQVGRLFVSEIKSSWDEK